MATFNPKWRQLADLIGIDTVIDKINELLRGHQRLLGGMNATRERLEQVIDVDPRVDKGTQILLSLKYRELAKAGVMLPFADVEFRNFSQNGEDGILHYIFSLIGTTSKRCVEICAGVGSESNSANLILHHGWYGLLIDGDKRNVERGVEFFGSHPDSKIMGPRFLRRWVKRDTVNSIIGEAGFEGEIDLLSLDMDGVDYWIWEALAVINPRVVLLEFMPQLGEQAVTVPYRDDFRAEWIPLFDRDSESGDEELAEDLSFWNRWTLYGGASLAAFNKLAKRKGYRLVGANSIGFNAFFVREDIAPHLLPEVTEADCHNDNNRERFARGAEKMRGFELESV